ncbi:hypothetical protein PVL29_019694 [Vitis rotundifolia]|uniref:Uncharacterized protein n=1 Tax=Vitis rotundifolia TaxID=103349 RepID=A0AA38Z1M4_VITRO|nr:hypothetical protein PVL29_019694 [Vitis rotundifolia]
MKFIMVGGVRSISELVDVEGRLMVENYTSSLGAWEPCPLLPVHFRSGKSLQWPHAAWNRQNSAYPVYALTPLQPSVFALFN